MKMGLNCIADVLQRCYVSEENGCWLWRGAFSARHPRLFVFDPALGKKRSMVGGYAVWTLVHGLVPMGRVVYNYKCSDYRCVNPAHFKCGTKKQEGAHHRTTGKLKGINRSLSNFRSSNKRNRKITLEVAEYIRTSPKKGIELAKELGVGATTISRYRNQHLGSRVKLAANASIFTWRPAS